MGICAICASCCGCIWSALKCIVAKICCCVDSSTKDGQYNSPMPADDQINRNQFTNLAHVVRVEQRPETKSVDVTMYHYTTQMGAEAIKAERKIKKSKNRAGAGDDAAFGEGAYFTTMDPTNAKLTIARNNYDTGTAFFKAQIKAGKLDYVIKVTARRDDDKLCMLDYKEAGFRDIILYKDSFPLVEGNYEIMKL